MTYLIDPALGTKGNAKAIRALFSPDEMDAEKEEYFAPETILECTGVESSLCTAAYTARRGGEIIAIGVGKEVLNNLPFMHLSLAEVCDSLTGFVACLIDLFPD